MHCRRVVPLSMNVRMGSGWDIPHGHRAGLSQTAFFSVVAQSMYAALARVLPDCQALVDHLSLNLTHWKAV